MVKKIFLSVNGTNAKVLKIETPETKLGSKITYLLTIGIYEKETSDISKATIVLDKQTAISFVNELKREIAKLTKPPF